jgi:hypothetical protein
MNASLMTRLGTWLVLAAALTIPRGAQAAVPTSQADINHLCAAWKDLGMAPTAQRVELSGAIASYESGFGKGWRSSGADSNNWGAIHTALPTCADGTKAARCPAHAPPSCPRGTFLHKDSDSDGPYHACFAEYASPREAALNFVKVLVQRQPCRHVDGALTVLDALDSGDAYKVAESLWATCYFTTHAGAPDADARVAEYAAALDRHRTVRSCPAWLAASEQELAPPSLQLAPGSLLRPESTRPGHVSILLRAVMESLLASRAPAVCRTPDAGAPQP